MGSPPRHDLQPAATRTKLAVLMREAQWTLDDIAHRLPEQRVTAAECTELADGLADLATSLRGYLPVLVLSGDTSPWLRPQGRIDAPGNTEVLSPVGPEVLRARQVATGRPAKSNTEVLLESNRVREQRD